MPTSRRDPWLRSQTSFEVELPFPPLLESWEHSDHPAQVRLATYRDRIMELAEPALKNLTPPLVLGFHAAGRPDIDAGCDLDNFLTPVVTALGGHNLFSKVWSTRGRPDERARLALAPAADVDLDLIHDVAPATIRLTVSPQRPEWKAAIAAALGEHTSANRSGPIDLGLRFGVSPRRNWISLWKPAIDALGGVLGHGDRPWHPRDDRIALLTLEREIRRDLGWDVEMTVRWTAR